MSQGEIWDEPEEIKLELDADEAQQNQDQDNDWYQTIDLSEEALGVCWNFKLLQICLVKATLDKVVVDVKFATQRVGRFTLTKKKACAKTKREIILVGKMKARICANFAKKQVWAKGKVCLTGVCVSFNQRIFKY